MNVLDRLESINFDLLVLSYSGARLVCRRFAGESNPGPRAPTPRTWICAKRFCALKKKFLRYVLLFKLADSGTNSSGRALVSEYFFD